MITIAWSNLPIDSETGVCGVFSKQEIYCNCCVIGAIVLDPFRVIWNGPNFGPFERQLQPKPPVVTLQLVIS